MNREAVWYCDCLPRQRSTDPEDHAPGCAFVRIAELEVENKRLLGEVVKGNQRDTSRAEGVRVLNMLVDTLRGKESEDE